MLKKLDKLILKAFAGPFLLTFAVVQFILLTHTLLKYLVLVRFGRTRDYSQISRGIELVSRRRCRHGPTAK